MSSDSGSVSPEKLDLLDHLCGLLDVPESLDRPTGLNHYLHTNDEPDPTFRAQILSVYMEHERTRLKAIKRNIAEVQTIVDRLWSIRSDSESLLRDYRTVVSPIRRLPPELLDRIFSFACSGRARASLEYAGEGDNPGVSPAFVLALVCRSWRSIIHRSGYTKAVATDIADIAIGRSGHHRFSVGFYAPYIWAQGESPFKFDDVLPIFLKDSIFWEELTIKASIPLMKLFDILPSHIGSVKSLDLTLDYDFDDLQDLYEHPVDAFAQMPSLTTLSGSAAFMTYLHLPLHQIRHFSAAPNYPVSDLYDIWDMLSRMTLLETCKIQYEHEERIEGFPDYSDLPTLSLPTVTACSISMYARPILSKLDLPSLEDCEFVSDTFYESTDTERDLTGLLSRFLTRAKAPGGLKHLSFVTNDRRIDYVELLNGLTGLHVLHLNRWFQIAEDQSLTNILEQCVNAPKYFLPDLQEFVLRDLYAKQCYADNNARLLRMMKEVRPDVQCDINIEYY